MYNTNAYGFGGGIAIDNGSAPEIVDVAIIYNEANHGAGIEIRDNSSPTLQGLYIIENEATNGNGGGIRIIGGSSLSLYNTVVSSNSSEKGAGLYFGDSSSASLCNLLADHNLASSIAGGIWATENSNINIYNSTIAENMAEGSIANGFYVTEESDVTVRNSIIWNDEQGQSESNIIDDSGIFTQQYSHVHGVDDGDPLFVQSENLGWWQPEDISSYQYRYDFSLGDMICTQSSKLYGLIVANV